MSKLWLENSSRSKHFHLHNAHYLSSWVGSVGYGCQILMRKRSLLNHTYIPTSLAWSIARLAVTIIHQREEHGVKTEISVPNIGTSPTHYSVDMAKVRRLPEGTLVPEAQEYAPKDMG
jgi:hypothetical protein